MFRHPSRREFIATATGAAASAILVSGAGPSPVPAAYFKLSVITDEITQDLARALEIASHEFALHYVELRGLWNKNIISLDAKEIAEVRGLLDRFQLQITDIASPLFKTDFPGAPKSSFSPPKPQYGADFSFRQQDEVWERAVAVARSLGSNRIRCFDFWRLQDPTPYRAAMNEALRSAAIRAEKENMVLLLENEFECNTATGAEAVQTLGEVRSPNFLLNWDPGNAAYAGEIAFPNGYSGLPKNRIGHMHCKDVVHKSDGSFAWAAMGRGMIDYVSQFRAMVKDGYRGTVSLETHWNGASSPEESTRQSMRGMKEQLQKAGALSSGMEKKST
jgi:L-ribulose-5-phosphate 3-epimerase